MKKWNVNLLTLFPEMFPGPLAHSIAGKALYNQLFAMNVVNIRDYALDKHKSVDDKVFGGGAGMLMKPDVLGAAIDDVMRKFSPSKLVYFTPRGEKFNQSIAKQLVNQESVLILCGRYEGVDQRIFSKYNFSEYSMGDYILSGGEIAAFSAIDACIRLIPGVIDNNEVNLEESFSEGKYQDLLEYDQYTRPITWENMSVPDVLISGNHKQIAKWRLENALENTRLRRPDLWKKYTGE